MAGTINFLRERQKVVGVHRERDHALFRVSMGILITVAVVSVAAFGTQLYLQFQLSAAEDELASLERTILSQESIEKSVVVTAQKLAVLQTLIDERRGKQDAIAYFSDIFGPNVIIKDIGYNAADAILSLRVEADSVFILDTVFNTLDSQATREQYQQVSKSELRRLDTGQYSMLVTVTL